MKIKAVIFDAGGVLHSFDAIVQQRALADYAGVSVEELEKKGKSARLLFTKGLIGEAEFYRRLLKDLGRPSKPPPSAALFLTGWDKSFKINQEVITLAKDLKNRGYKLAVLSNTNPVHARWNREHGVYDSFPVAVLSCEVGLVKPDPAIYRLTLERLGVAADEAVFIDDTAENVAAARALGLTVIKFENPAQLRRELVRIGLIASEAGGAFWQKVPFVFLLSGIGFALILLAVLFLSGRL